MAQWVDCLLYKYQGLSPDLQHPYKDLGVVTQNQVALVLSCKNSTKYSAYDSVTTIPNKTTR